VDANRDGNRTAGTVRAAADRLRSLAMIVIFYVAVPLAVYNLLRSAGLTAVTALLLSGVFPAAGVAIGIIRHRRLDVAGALVLAGIIVGTVLGLVSHSARLVLVEGSVPRPYSPWAAWPRCGRAAR
jgi:predicted lysophospholipase L1 biosynthesis ABC-type transport system permease subunit